MESKACHPANCILTAGQGQPRRACPGMPGPPMHRPNGIFIAEENAEWRHQAVERAHLWQISESFGLPSDAGPSHLCGHLCEVQVAMTIAYKRTTMASCDTTVRVERPVIYKVWAQQSHIFLNPPYIWAFHTYICTYICRYIYL